MSIDSPKQDTFIEPDSLSSDLEWMLQSGQASQEMLVEALVNTYYGRIFHLAYSFLDDAGEAAYISIETFITALLEVYRYRPETGAHVWITRLAIDKIRERLHPSPLSKVGKTLFSGSRNGSVPGTPSASEGLDRYLWLVVDTLSEKLRWPFLLNSLYGWQATEISRLLNIKEKTAQTRLDAAWRKVNKSLSDFSIQTGNPLEDLESKVSLSLHSRWHAADFSEKELDFIMGEVLAQSQSRSTRRRSFTSLKEVVMVGTSVILVLAVIWGANRLLPEPEVEPLPTISQPQVTTAPEIQGNSYAMQNPRSNSLIPPYNFLYFPSPGETLETIAKKIGISYQELSELNQFDFIGKIPDGVGVLVPLETMLNEKPSEKPVSPAPRILTPLTEDTHMDIFNYLLSSSNFWRTLWADVRVIEYGPEGYVGPPLVYREQAWVNQPEQRSLIQMGPLDGNPVYYLINRQGFSFFFNQDHSDVLRTFYEAKGLLEFSQAKTLIFPQESPWIEKPGRLEATGSENMLGRQTVIVDWVNQEGQREYRLWVDSLTGVLLRLQQYTGRGMRTLTFEVSMTAIALDVDFPPDIFDPRIRGPENFAQDYTLLPALPETQSVSNRFPAPGHEYLQPKPAPYGFDPSTSYLTFQYPRNLSNQARRARKQPFVDLYADDFYLGRVPFAGPWKVICDRSPDGTKIAFTEAIAWQSFEHDRGPYRFGWFHLLAPQQVYFYPDLTDVSEFAFAPDSRRLAILGPGTEFTRAVYILDTETGLSKDIYHLEGGSSLAWSPDGKYLTLIAITWNTQGIAVEKTLVLDADSGEVVYSAPSQWELRQRLDTGAPEGVAEDWPGYEWGIEFPVQLGNLEACSTPPGK